MAANIGGAEAKSLAAKIGNRNTNLSELFQKFMAFGVLILLMIFFSILSGGKFRRR
jgi:hypothetical protein